MSNWTLPELSFDDNWGIYTSGNNYLCSTNDFNNVPVTPPVTDGLVGMYTADSWNGIHWADLSGNDNHVTTFSGTITKLTSGINGRTFIYGDTSSSLKWPAAILPSTYTLFHIAKYNNGVKQRIFTKNGGTQDWFSGFSGNSTVGFSGVAYHNGWLTPIVDCCGSDWVFSTDQNDLYR